MPNFQVVQHPDYKSTIFIVTPNDDLDFEYRLEGIARSLGGHLREATDVADGGRIYNYNFPNANIAKKAIRDIKTARTFNMV